MISDHQLHILRHSLGLDDNGNGRPYRNHFVCDPDADMVALVDLGLMEDLGSRLLHGGMRTYRVTDSGRLLVLRLKPVAPKLSRSQRRYREFLNLDGGMSFGEYLKSPLSSRP